MSPFHSSAETLERGFGTPTSGSAGGGPATVYTGAKRMTIPAKYENGVFRPLRDVPIKEGTIVEVYVPVETPSGTALYWRFAPRRHVERS